MMTSRMTDRTKGIMFIILSAFGFAMMSTFVKLAGDLPSFQKLFFRNIVAALVALTLIVKHRGSFVGERSSRKTLVLRSIFGTIGAWMNYYAIDHMILSDANMLNKLSPLFVIIFSFIILKEKVNTKQMIAICIAFGGALFIIKPTFSMEVIPALVGVGGAIFAGLAYTCLRALGKSEPYYTVVFFFSVLSSLMILPIVLLSYEPMTNTQLMYLVMAGVFASIGQIGTTLAYKFAPAKEISIFDYTNIIFSAIIGAVIFDVLPDMYSIIGYAIIFGVAMYMYLYNKKLDMLKK